MYKDLIYSIWIISNVKIIKLLILQEIIKKFLKIKFIGSIFKLNINSFSKKNSHVLGYFLEQSHCLD